MPWPPTTITQFIRGIPSSTRTALVETDAGSGYLKALGNPEGPHALASEWVGTRLAEWFGLPVLDHAIIRIEQNTVIPNCDPTGAVTGKASPGPAWITRAEPGITWGGTARDLELVENKADVTRLVVSETWVLNCDRYSVTADGTHRRINRGNVFLSEECRPGLFRLKAIDHTHCFTCGREWTRRLAQVDTIRDERLFGLFPEFRPFLDRTIASQAIRKLDELDRSVPESIVASIPREWDVSATAASSLIELLSSRARFVVEHVESRMFKDPTESGGMNP